MLILVGPIGVEYTLYTEIIIIFRLSRPCRVKKDHRPSPWLSSPFLYFCIEWECQWWWRWPYMRILKAVTVLFLMFLLMRLSIFFAIVFLNGLFTFCLQWVLVSDSNIMLNICVLLLVHTSLSEWTLLHMSSLLVLMKIILVSEWCFFVWNVSKRKIVVFLSWYWYLWFYSLLWYCY